MKKIVSSVVLLTSFVLSGCASDAFGNLQYIKVTTLPEANAACTLKSPAGSWKVNTPGTATVRKSKHDINITCRRIGYDNASAVIPSTINGARLAGDLIGGGLVAVGTSAATGAINRYPHEFEVRMRRNGENLLPGQPLASTGAGLAPGQPTPVSSQDNYQDQFDG